MSKNYSASDYNTFKDLLGAAASGRFKNLAEAAEMAVDRGLSDCPCGQPDCPSGQAIRAEYSRRRNGQNATQPALTAAQIEEATYRGQLRAMRDFAREQRNRSLRMQLWRVIQLVGLLIVMVFWKVVGFAVEVVFAPIEFFRSAKHWQHLEQMAGRLAELNNAMSRDGKHWTTDETIKQMAGLVVYLGYLTGKTLHTAAQKLPTMLTYLRRKPTAAPAPAAAVTEEPAAE